MATKENEKLTRWDAADYIEDAEDARLYLNAAIEDDDGDGRMVRRALAAVVRAQGVSKLMREAGLSRRTFYESLGENGNPSFVAVVKITHALGLRLRLESIKAS
ncbi:MAG: putative addiction module antidote protein [Dehalococcoidia bacterium]|nr:putative addiction module antidote protein [Dehalococcoidia bacterium]